MITSSKVADNFYTECHLKENRSDLRHSEAVNNAFVMYLAMTIRLYLFKCFTEHDVR